MMVYDDGLKMPPEPDSIEGPKTPAEYFKQGREWLEVAEWETIENKASDRSVALGILAMAHALLGICAQFIHEQENG